MVFSQTTFLFLFLPIVLIAYYNPFFKSTVFKNVILVISSILFYAWGEPIYVLLMLASIIINWIFGLLANGKSGKIFVGLSVVFNIGILFVFKYLGFLIENINSALNTNIANTNLSLPIGISFFTFQAMSYVIDVYRKNGEAQKNPMNVALYISFFPQLIAGPIVRYNTIAQQIKHREENFSHFTEGVYRFIYGFLKKVLIANNVAIVADGIFDNKENAVATAWIGAIAYTMQIYFDFSGYSEMAIGLGKMFGFDFSENFDYPYVSKSVSEFWRRWHISLGTWFRDYVYFPLGGSRVSKPKLVRNLFIVWALTGIWHGANWTFLVWGLMFFVVLTIEKLSGFTKKIGAFGHIYTMLIVIIGWVIFRSDSLLLAGNYLKNMIGIGTSLVDDDTMFYLSNYIFYLITGVIFSFPIVPAIRKKIKKENQLFNILYGIVLIVLFVVAITFIVKGSYNPFIYFNF